MAIIQIQSKDPQFGFIIKKNPNSGMLLRTIRQGTVFAWYSNEGTAFNILFKDADNAVSFGDQEFEFLNTSRYNSPHFVINAIGEFFTSNVREEVEIDTKGIEKSFMVNMVDINRKYQVQHFAKYFTEFNIELEHYAAKSFKITVTTTESFHKLFNFMNLFMLFLSLASKSEYMQLDQSGVEKYMGAIEKLDAPFFIRYLFSRAMFRSKKQFTKFKERLETTSHHKSVNMVYGDTAMQRRSAIEKLLPFDKAILDVGCGEGFYAIPFSQKISDFTYYAIDIDSNLTDIVNKKAQKKEIENIRTFNHISEFIETEEKSEKRDVILTEVIEHMPQNKSVELINIILNNVDFENFIITVPNRDFNKFYLISEDDSRHDDHDWEPSSDEFRIFMSEIVINNGKILIEFIDIGDTIDNISTSIGCVIKRM